MSIYGEGEYVCPEHGATAPGPRPEAQLLARDWECLCPHCGRELRPIGTRETKPLLPTSVYAITKRDHEELSLVVGAAYGVPTVALRFFNVYGPGQALSNPYTGVAAIFASRLLNGRPPVIFEDGRQSRDFIHVSDIVQGILRALESDTAVGQALNLGTGHAATVNEVAELLSRGLGVEVEAVRTDQYRAGDIRHCYADTALAENLLGFRAAVEIEAGMGELARWLAGQEAVDRVDAATSELVARGLAR
jgi:dTDP-L-rhamnose 4-epimerase